MDEYEREVELIDYIEVLLKRRTLIVAVTVMCGLAMGLYAFLGTRQYEGQALVVVSQPLASSRTTDSEGVLGTEIQVTGLAAQTYEALAKSDELVQGLRDTLLAMPSVSQEAKALLREADVSQIAEGMLSAELVEATEKAESPLLAFRAQSSFEDLPVALVNRWTELFVERHRGLSSNVADDYYQWVQGQFAIAKDNLESTEDALRDLTRADSELNVLSTEVEIKTARLDADLRTYQELSTELEAKQRELRFARSRIRELESGDTWIGYLETSTLPSAVQRGAAGPRAVLLALRRDLETARADSFDQAADMERANREFEAEERDRLLTFERRTGIERVRRRVSEVDSSLSAYRTETARLDQRVKDLGLSLEVYGRNLADEPSVLQTAKAVVDEDLWRRVGDEGKVDEDVQKALSRYRLVSEEVNPTHQQLSAEIRQLQLQYDRATTRIGFLEGEIPLLEAELSQLQGGLDTLAQQESVILNDLSRQRSALEDSLARRAQPVVEQLGRKREALAARRQDYSQLKAQEQALTAEVTSLQQRVGFEKDSFQRWSQDVGGRRAVADSLARLRRTLEREQEVYQETFTRFSNLLEEARIAREQAAGDIQIVSRAVVARPVPRGTVKKASIAAIVGLMGSVMLAFLLEYVQRSREGREKEEAASA